MNCSQDQTPYQALIFVSIRNPPDAYKWVEMEPKHNYVLFKTSLFGPFIGSWSSFSYMYVSLICNVSPTSTFLPWNAHHILTELSKWFECVDLGRNMFGDLEQHGWIPVGPYCACQTKPLKLIFFTSTSG